ncbi:MAG: hypothetical protein HOP96_10435 [Sphingomonas sp.]|nr:hypothetical protein [Sphingomonas sp.]
MKTALLLAAIAATAFTFPASMALSAPPSPASLQQFAKCATDNYEGAELLATQPGSAEEAEVLAEYGRRSCRAPEVGPGVLRGAVAEQLFKTDFGSIGAEPRRDLIEVFTVDSNELVELGADARKRIDYVAFGTCVAASDPDKSSSLLRTAAGSAEEKDQMTQMVPEFAPCINQGERFDFSRTDLRSALAEGAYRLALAQSMDEEVVVTGTRDPSKSVTCKREPVTGSRFRRTVCLTDAQWEVRKRQTDLAMKDLTRQAREYQERKTACITRSLFPGDGGGGPCLMQ